MADIRRGGIRIQGFANAEMDFQLLRQLGSTAYGAASVGECLSIANRMPSDDPGEWVKEFERLAQWQKQDGLERLADNHVVSGRSQLFKACNSYRAAEYYSPCSSEHHRVLGLNSADCFVTAISSMEVHFELHSIPYKDIQIPIYFISPENDGRKRKTLLIVSGFDGTLEEEFFMRGLAGLERNYNIILFAGPGQMDVFRRYPHTSFEPDFENVVKKVIDHFAHREEVDMSRLALLGISIGGYFAPRAAAHEPRIKALIANSPILNVHSYLVSFIGEDPCTIADEEDFELEDLPKISDEEFPPQLKVQTEQLLIRYGRRSFKKTFEYLKQFNIGDALNHIQCPCLALIGESEGLEPRKQYEHFCKKVNADCYDFNDFVGAGTHCQVGNVTFANAVMYDWLDKL